jgi:sugar lactone lactonase YvrE
VRAIVAETDQLGECPVWDDRTRRLSWIDVTGKRLSSCTGSGGKIARTMLPDHPGSFRLRAEGGMILAFRRGIALFDAGGQEIEYQGLPAEIAPRERFNDGACDARGRYWVGTMDRHMRDPVGGLYRIDADLSIRRMTDGLCLSNGIAWSPDGASLYQCESRPARIYVHDFDVEAGAVANRRIFIEFAGDAAGGVDGCAMDAEGFLWVASPRAGKILRFDPTGKLEREIATPIALPTCIGFGGDDLKTMFVTSMRPQGGSATPLDGAVFAEGVDVAGMAACRFAG